MGQSRFSGFCPYLHYTGVFGHVNKTCLKQAVFTGCVRLDVLQNRFPAGNGSAPSPACVRSIFSWYPWLPDTAFSKGCHLTEKPSCFWWLFGADDWILQWHLWCKSVVLLPPDIWNMWTRLPSYHARIYRFSGTWNPIYPWTILTHLKLFLPLELHIQASDQPSVFLMSLYETNFVELRIWWMIHCWISVFG